MRSFLLVLGLVVVPLASACSAFTGVDSDGLVVAGDGGSDDDGDSGKSTRDSGTSRDGGSKTDSGGGTTTGPELGPECTALQSCCDFLETSAAATCRTTALDANESSCSANLSAYQADGVCGGVSPVVDSGTTSPPPPPIDSGLLAGGYCSDLLACCGSDASCLSIALAGNESQCELEYLTEIESGGTSCVGVP
jgi:hypothetical protein